MLPPPASIVRKVGGIDKLSKLLARADEVIEQDWLMSTPGTTPKVLTGRTNSGY
jgi:hypothetical protein